MIAKRGPKGIKPEQYVEALRETFGNISMAARKLGVDRMSVVNAIEKHPIVKEAHDEAAEQITDIAEGHLVAAVRKGDMKQVQYWLENKARHRGYGSVYVHNTHSGPNNGPIEIQTYDYAAAAAGLAARPSTDRDKPEHE
jgi:hypothetical protein